MRNLILVSLLIISVGLTADAKLIVHLDVTEVPQLTEWGNKAKILIEEWYPRALNMIPTKGFEVPSEIWLKFEKKEEGVAATSENHIFVSSNWIEKHPEDIGCVFHEMVHVIQNYKGHVPGWITEGIADYLRWALYEGKNQSWYPLNDKPQGYKASYQITGGFFLWLETEACPGIVNKLNTAARKDELKDLSIFEKASGKPIDALWDEYLKDRKKQ